MPPDRGCPVTARDLHSHEVEAARKAWMDSWARYTVAPGENDDRILRLRLADAIDAVEPIIRADERATVDAVRELLQRQQILHRRLIAPTHPNAPVLIEVSRVLSLLDGVSDD